MKFIRFAPSGFGVVLAASLAGCGGFSLGSLNPWSGPVERPGTLPAGALFANGSTTLQLQGDRVFLEEEGAVTYSNCRKAAG